MSAVKKSVKHLIDEKRFAIAMGATCALGLFFLGAFSSLYGIGDALVEIIGTLFRGYEGTPVGVGIGVIWGFIDGAIFGGIFAWIYNNTKIT